MPASAGCLQMDPTHQHHEANGYFYLDPEFLEPGKKISSVFVNMSD